MRSRLARFASVGVVNVAIDAGIYTALVFFGIPFLLANAVSTLCGLTFSFFANRSFTFQARGASPVWKQAALFFVVVGFGLWVIQPVVILLTEPLWGRLGVQAAIVVVLSKLSAIAVALVWNYILLGAVVFRTGRGRDDTGAADAE